MNGLSNLAKNLRKAGFLLSDVVKFLQWLTESLEKLPKFSFEEKEVKNELRNSDTSSVTMVD
jgi:hypothetical protein